MNPNFVTIALWILGALIQMLAFMYLRTREKGRQDQQLEDAGKLEDRVLELETQVANIKGWLYGAFGKTMNGR